MNPRPLVVRHGALGDIVLMTVAIRHLHQRFGQPVDVLAAGPWVRELLEGQPGVGLVYTLASRRTPYWLSGEQRALVQALRTRGAGPTWLFDHDPGKACRVLARAGWSPNDWCHYDGLRDVPGPHFCDLWLRYAYRNPPVLGGADLPLTAADAYGQLQLLPAQAAVAQQWRTASGLGARPWILVQAGNKRTMRRGPRRRRSNSKYWPEARWAAVLQGLRARHPGHDLVLLGVPQEAALNEEILALAAVERSFNAAPGMDIARLLGLAAGAAGMVSVDTGPAHVVAAFDRPVLALFGISGPHYYAPRAASAPVRCLTGEIDGQRTMLGIEAAEVLAAWDEMHAIP